MTPEAPIALGFRGRPFHDPFHGLEAPSTLHRTATRTVAGTKAKRPAAPLVREEEAVVPGRPVNAGSSRSLPDNPIDRLTCGQPGRPAAQTDLLGSGSL